MKFGAKFVRVRNGKSLKEVYNNACAYILIIKKNYKKPDNVSTGREDL